MIYCLKAAVYNTSVYFKNTYEPEWITSDLARKIIEAESAYPATVPAVPWMMRMDSREYLSWEGYFTKLLTDRTVENGVCGSHYFMR